MPETTPLIKAALNLRGGAGFDVYFFSIKSKNSLYENFSLIKIPLYINIKLAFFIVSLYPIKHINFSYYIVASQVSKQCPRTYPSAFCLLEAHPQSP